MLYLSQQKIGKTEPGLSFIEPSKFLAKVGGQTVGSESFKLFARFQCHDSVWCFSRFSFFRRFIVGFPKMALQPPRAMTREKSPVQEKIAMFMNNTSRTDDPSKLGELEYGRPVVGSKTEARGLKAHAHVFREILELCEIIHSDGDIRFVDDDGIERIGILFGDLFRIYTVISDKCVGLLLRARKHSLVTFEGETLFQRRDDNTPIFLTKPLSEIREQLMAAIKGEDHTVPWHTGVTGTAKT